MRSSKAIIAVLFSFLISSAAFAELQYSSAALSGEMARLQESFFKEAYSSYLSNVRQILQMEQKETKQSLGEKVYSAPPFQPQLSRNGWLTLFSEWTWKKCVEEVGENQTLKLQDLKKISEDHFTSYYQNEAFARVSFLGLLDLSHVQSSKSPFVAVKRIENLELPRAYPGEHTLNVDAYVSDRFPRALQSFVKSHNIDLFLDDGNCENALAYQKSDGYGTAVQFMGPRDSAASQFLIVSKNSARSPYRFVACDIVGQDDATRLIAILGPQFQNAIAKMVHHQKGKPIFSFNSNGENLVVDAAKDRVIIGYQNTVWWQLATSPEASQWNRVLLTADGAEVDLFENKVTGQRIFSLANVYGDEMSKAMALLYAKGFRRFIYMGTAGGLDPAVTIGDVLLPSSFVKPDGSEFAFENSAASSKLALTGSAKIVAGTRQGWIATLIQETIPRIRFMAFGQSIQALDVESRYFAEFITQHSNIAEKKLIIIVSDTPLGTITFDQEAVLKQIPANSVKQLISQILAD